MPMPMPPGLDGIDPQLLVQLLEMLKRRGLGGLPPDPQSAQRPEAMGPLDAPGALPPGEQGYTPLDPLGAARPGEVATDPSSAARPGEIPPGLFQLMQQAGLS